VQSNYDKSGKAIRQQSILMTIGGTIRTHNAGKRTNRKSYCFPSQATIMARLAQFHGITCSRRTLCRDMAELEARGMIKRIQRHTKAPEGHLWLRSTAYYLGAACAGLARQAKRLLDVVKTAVPNLAHNYRFAVKDSSTAPKGSALLDAFHCIGGDPPPVLSDS